MDKHTGKRLTKQQLIERSRALRAQLAELGHTHVTVGGAIKRALDADESVTAAQIAAELAAENVGREAAIAESTELVKRLVRKVVSL
jgi:hypothetical protein